MTNSDPPILALTEGIGIHTGVPSTMSFTQGSGSLKIFLENLGIEHLFEKKDLDRQAMNGTILKTADGKIFHTPEHLLATCLPFHRQPLELKVLGGECPIGDGSALGILTAFAEALEKSPDASDPWFLTYDTLLIENYSSGDSWLMVEPADEFSIHYTLERGEVSQSYTWDLSARGAMQDYFNHILPARTFIFRQDFLVAKNRGLLKGATPESGILLAESASEFQAVLKSGEFPYSAEFPYLNRTGERMANELACHKILDLLGDLALIALSLPRLKITARNTGHFQNLNLVKDLIHERNTREL